MAEHTRRQFLTRLGASAVGLSWACEDLALSRGLGNTSVLAPARTSARTEARGSGESARRPRVVIARDEVLTRGRVAEHVELLTKLLNAAMQRITGASDAAAAWRAIFGPNDRVGIKVNTLGRSTQPAVVDAIVAGLRSADVRAENILIWDRFDVELAQAGFRLNKSMTGVQCRGTDAEHVGNGYQRKIEVSGEIGSCFSRIVAQEVTALICVPVLKDHSLAGASLGMKNFYGAIHNPNKYHDHHCDPYVVDVVSHRFIAPKWRLTVCDATRGQYHAGPTHHPGYTWRYGGLIVSRDFVAADAVAADLLETQRKTKGLASLSDEERPASHIFSAAKRGLGVADLGCMDRIEL